MRNNTLKYMAAALATASFLFISCEDDLSTIGNSLAQGELVINVDSVFYDLKASSIKAPALESKSDFTLLGSISVPEYGDLSCSYVTQFLPTQNLNLPDTITYEKVDSVRMILSIPKSYIVGDSLISQQVKVYSLTKQLPSDIAASFDPTGYFDPAQPLGIKNYNLSGETYTDSTYSKSSVVFLKVPMPKEIGTETFKAYEETPDIFLWPQEFAKLWPGVYVQPTFGKGCLAPVANTSIYAYYPKTTTGAITDSSGSTTLIQKIVADSVCMYTSAPEVISSVNIDYRPSAVLDNMVSEGKAIITTPGGYAVNFTFPAIEILDEYWDKRYDLGVINNLNFSIPASEVKNKYGITVPPSLLMVKTSEVDEFFENGKVPDNINSFVAKYSSASGAYEFNSLRQYIVNLRAKGEGNITEEDVNFSLIPVEITTEDFTNPYTGEVTFYVSKLLPYISTPTMVELNTDKAHIIFTYSNQVLN